VTLFTRAGSPPFHAGGTECGVDVSFRFSSYFYGGFYHLSSGLPKFPDQSLSFFSPFRTKCFLSPFCFSPSFLLKFPTRFVLFMFRNLYTLSLYSVVLSLLESFLFFDPLIRYADECDSPCIGPLYITYSPDTGS